MTISYPITCPSTLKPGSTRWSTTSTIVVSTSPTTLQSVKYEYDGEAWGVTVSYPLLTRAEAAPFFAFLAALRGQNGTFMFGDTLLSSPLGTAAGTPLVQNSNQEGRKVLTTKGWTANQVVLKGGDFFQIDNRLYMVLQDVTSDASGDASIDVFPRVRQHLNNAPLILTNPKGIFRLGTDDVTIVDAGPTQLFSISFSAVEAF